MGQSQELLKREFMHFISDTLALLGGGDDLVNKIRQCEEKPFTPQLIDEVKGYNMKQIDRLKSRLALLNTTEVSVHH